MTFPAIIFPTVIRSKMIFPTFISRLMICPPMICLLMICPPMICPPMICLLMICPPMICPLMICPPMICPTWTYNSLSCSCILCKNITLRSWSELMAVVGKVVRRLFSKLRELRLLFTSWNTDSSRRWITFLSRFRAVKEPIPARSVLDNSCIWFCARSRNARPPRFLIAGGKVLRWHPFRFRFFKDCSNPARESSAKVTLLSESFNVFNLRVTKALLGRNLILLLERSRELRIRRVRRVSTGTESSSLSARFKPWRVSSRPRKAFWDIDSRSAFEIWILLILRPRNIPSSNLLTALLLTYTMSMGDSRAYSRSAAVSTVKLTAEHWTVSSLINNTILVT